MAGNNDILHEDSIDKILEDVRRLTGERKETDTKVWSLDEIDALLADTDVAENENKSYSFSSEILSDLDSQIEEDVLKTQEKETEKFEISENFVFEDISSNSDEADSEEDLHQKEKENIPSKDKDEEIFSQFEISIPEDDDLEQNDETEQLVEMEDILSKPDLEETQQAKVDDYSEDLKEVINAHIPPKPETVSISRETSSGIGLKEFARSKGIIEKEQSEYNEDINSDEDIFEDSTEKPEMEAEQVIEPLIDGAVLNDEPENIQDEEKIPAESDDIPGQISIEKTRLFNEVEARAIKNENIEHHIGNKIIKTAEIPQGTKMETDPYRERFLHKPELSIEKTQEHKDILDKLPAKTIERHGVVVKKSDLGKTGEDGLSPVPILVDAIDEYDAQKKLVLQTQTGTLKSNALMNTIEEEQLDNQIVLDGFDEEEQINEVSEAEAERALLKVRKDRASKFRLFPNLEENDDEDEMEDISSESETQVMSETQDEEAESAKDIQDDEDEDESFVKRRRRKAQNDSVRVEREFFGPKDAKAVFDIYDKKSSGLKIKIIVSVIAIVLLAISAVITSLFKNFALFGESPLVYVAINLLMLIIVAAINNKSIINSFKILQKKKINSDTAISVSLIVGLIQSAVAFGFENEVANGIHIYSAIAILVVTFINIGEYTKNRNDMENFILLNEEKGNFYALKQVEDEGVAFEISRSLMIKDPDVRYSAKVGFPYKFVEMSKKIDPTQNIFTLVIPVALIAAAVSGVISAVINKNVFVGVTAFSGVLFMGLPSLSVLSAFGIMKKVNKNLSEDGSMISGYEAIDDIALSNALVMDASDLFENGESTVYGIKLYNSMRIDEAILYTAAVVIQSNGPLQDVFDGIILSNREMLPTVESLAYEDRLGCSGWIYNYRVLVGNRDLLIKHNVDVQSKEMELKFTKAGRKVMYLAVEGKVAAMFVVGYQPDAQTAYYLRKLEKSGIGVLVRTSDANITEELIEQYFNLPQNYVKVISPVAGAMYKEISEQKEETEPCRIVHNGKLNSMLRAYIAAFSVNDRNKISVILQYIGLGLGILIMSMLSFVSGLSQAGVLQILLYELFWALIVVFIPRLKKI